MRFVLQFVVVLIFFKLFLPGALRVVVFLLLTGVAFDIGYLTFIAN